MDVGSGRDNDVSSHDLPHAAIPFLPPSCYYFPDFITRLEEQRILSEILSIPSSRWTRLSHRRLLSLPSPLTGASRDTLLAAPFPPCLSTTVIPKISKLGLFSESPHGSPNHVLVNEYHAGQGIMPHEDGPAYHPLVATVSLAAPIVLDIYVKNVNGEGETGPKWRILQEPRSLLVTTGQLYRDTLHGIAEVQVDEDLAAENIANWGMLGHREPYEKGSYPRQTRISLTLRDVLKVLRLGGALKYMHAQKAMSHVR